MVRSCRKLRICFKKVSSSNLRLFFVIFFCANAVALIRKMCLFSIAGNESAKFCTRRHTEGCPFLCVSNKNALLALRSFSFVAKLTSTWVAFRGDTIGTVIYKRRV